jgi:hypothetical protein
MVAGAAGRGAGCVVGARCKLAVRLVDGAGVRSPTRLPSFGFAWSRAGLASPPAHPPRLRSFRAAPHDHEPRDRQGKQAKGSRPEGARKRPQRPPHDSIAKQNSALREPFLEHPVARAAITRTPRGQPRRDGQARPRREESPRLSEAFGAAQGAGGRGRARQQVLQVGAPPPGGGSAAGGRIPLGPRTVAARARRGAARPPRADGRACWTAGWWSGGRSRWRGGPPRRAPAVAPAPARPCCGSCPCSPLRAVACPCSPPQRAGRCPLARPPQRRLPVRPQEPADRVAHVAAEDAQGAAHR